MANPADSGTAPVLPPRRVYPAWMGDGPYTALQTQLAETLGRIADRTDHWVAEEAAKVKALAHCRRIAAEFTQ